ncbi:hypothetical protein PENSPDRAFT_658983 [Peniophora sp. CONT]|nr:hypothetical protein PENSPDRAFT_658983 [Peniophora sp. CONT]
MVSFFHLTFFSLAALLVMLLYRYRATLPLPQSIRTLLNHPSSNNYERLSTFSDQAAAGITSSNFDIEANNLREGDLRMGLDENGTREVMDIMRRENVTFDQARLIRQNRMFAANGIDPSGMPLDAKAVTRL